MGRLCTHDARGGQRDLQDRAVEPVIARRSQQGGGSTAWANEPHVEKCGHGRVPSSRLRDFACARSHVGVEHSVGPRRARVSQAYVDQVPRARGSSGLRLCFEVATARS